MVPSSSDKESGSLLARNWDVGGRGGLEGKPQLGCSCLRRVG